MPKSDASSSASGKSSDSSDDDQKSTKRSSSSSSISDENTSKKSSSSSKTSNKTQQSKSSASRGSSRSDKVSDVDTKSEAAKSEGISEVLEDAQPRRSIASHSVPPTMATIPVDGGLVSRFQNLDAEVDENEMRTASRESVEGIILDRDSSSQQQFRNHLMNTVDAMENSKPTQKPSTANENARTSNGQPNSSNEEALKRSNEEASKALNERAPASSNEKPPPSGSSTRSNVESTAEGIEKKMSAVDDIQKKLSVVTGAVGDVATPDFITKGEELIANTNFQQKETKTSTTAVEAAPKERVPETRLSKRADRSSIYNIKHGISDQVRREVSDDLEGPPAKRSTVGAPGTIVFSRPIGRDDIGSSLSLQPQQSGGSPAASSPSNGLTGPLAGAMVGVTQPSTTSQASTPPVPTSTVSSQPLSTGAVQAALTKEHGVHSAKPTSEAQVQSEKPAKKLSSSDMSDKLSKAEQVLEVIATCKQKFGPVRDHILESISVDMLKKIPETLKKKIRTLEKQTDNAQAKVAPLDHALDHPQIAEGQLKWLCCVMEEIALLNVLLSEAEHGSKVKLERLQKELVSVKATAAEAVAMLHEQIEESGQDKKELESAHIHIQDLIAQAEHDKKLLESAKLVKAQLIEQARLDKEEIERAKMERHLAEETAAALKKERLAAAAANFYNNAKDTENVTHKTTGVLDSAGPPSKYSNAGEVTMENAVFPMSASIDMESVFSGKLKMVKDEAANDDANNRNNDIDLRSGTLGPGESNVAVPDPAPTTDATPGKESVKNISSSQPIVEGLSLPEVEAFKLLMENWDELLFDDEATFFDSASMRDCIRLLRNMVLDILNRKEEEANILLKSEKISKEFSDLHIANKVLDVAEEILEPVVANSEAKDRMEPIPEDAITEPIQVEDSPEIARLTESCATPGGGQSTQQESESQSQPVENESVVDNNQAPIQNPSTLASNESLPQSGFNPPARFSQLRNSQVTRIVGANVNEVLAEAIPQGSADARAPASVPRDGNTPPRFSQLRNSQQVRTVGAKLNEVVVEAFGRDATPKSDSKEASRSNSKRASTLEEGTPRSVSRFSTLRNSQQTGIVGANVNERVRGASASEDTQTPEQILHSLRLSVRAWQEERKADLNARNC